MTPLSYQYCGLFSNLGNLAMFAAMRRAPPTRWLVVRPATLGRQRRKKLRIRLNNGRRRSFEFGRLDVRLNFGRRLGGRRLSDDFLCVQGSCA